MEETQKKELYNEHSIGLYDVQNARDLGGYKTIDGRTVKTGLLIRSGRLSNASKEDIHILKDLYHLNAVVDFRIIRERIDSPDVKIDGVTYYTLPLVDDNHPWLVVFIKDLQTTRIHYPILLTSLNRVMGKVICM